MSGLNRVSANNTGRAFDPKLVFDNPRLLTNYRIGADATLGEDRSKVD